MGKDRKKIELIIEGTHENNNHVTFDVFMSALDNFKQALKTFDAAIHSKAHRNGFRVVKLSHSSPATVGVEPYNMDKNASFAPQEFINKFNEEVDAVLNRGETIYDVPDSFYQNIKNIVKHVGRNARSVQFNIEEKSFEIQTGHEAILNNIISAKESCFSSYKGALEQINIHDKKNTFRIYPITGPTSIKCTFPSSLEEIAIESVGRDVIVSGYFKYKSASPFPEEIAVESIELCPLEVDLPSLQDLRGIAPNATGDMLSEDFVRELRDEWG